MPLSDSEYVKRQRPAPDWIIPGLLKRQNTMLIHGEPKEACKTYLSTKLAFDVAHCRPLWGIHGITGAPAFVPPHPMRTVHFCMEDTEDDIQDRIVDVAINAGGETPTAGLFYAEAKDFRYKLDTPMGMMAIRQVLDAVVASSGPIDIVIFDPLRDVMSGDENSSKDVMEIYQAARFIQQTYNCSTIITHHITKPPTIPNSSWDPASPYVMRGSGALYGSTDAVVGIVPSKANSSTPNLHHLALYFKTKRSGAQRPVKLTVDTATAKIVFKGFKA